MMQQQINAIIVDDEGHAREALRTMLREYAQINIVAECENGIDAIREINALHPQLLFLDIHMPKLDGFDVIELLGDDAPLTVFVTAYDEYAVRAFDNNALDYLLKPLDPRRLQKTVERVEQRLVTAETTVPAKLIRDRRQTLGPLQRLLVRDGGEVHIIPADEILYVEAADDYVAIQTADKTHIKQDRLQNLEKLLDPKIFCRTHRSCLLNLNYLSGIESETKDSKIAIMKNGSRLPISRSGYNRLKNRL